MAEQVTQQTIEIRSADGTLLGYRIDTPKGGHFYVDPENRDLVGASTVAGSAFDKSTPLTQWAANMASSAWRTAVSKEPCPITEERATQIHNGARFRHRRAFKRAGVVGTQVHAVIEEYIGHRMGQGDPPDLRQYGEVETAALQQFQTWERKQQVTEFLGVEVPVVHAQYRYAGTLDFLARRAGDSRVLLGDLKTSSGLRLPYRLQLAAYIRAYEAMVPGVEIGDNRTLIHIDRDTGVLTPYDLEAQQAFEGGTSTEEDFTAFLSALWLHHYQQRAVI